MTSLAQHHADEEELELETEANVRHEFFRGDLNAVFAVDDVYQDGLLGA